MLWCRAIWGGARITTTLAAASIGVVESHRCNVGALVDAKGPPREGLIQGLLETGFFEDPA